MTSQEKLAESTTLVVLSRLSMLVTPLLLAGLIFAGKIWLQDRFDGLRIDVDALQAEMPMAKERIKVIETTMVRGREDREEFQRQTTETLSDIVAAQTQMMKELAAITAIVDERERQRLMEQRGR